MLVQPQGRVTVDILRMSDSGQENLSGRNRLRILIGVLGVIVVLGAAFALDGLLARRKRQRAVQQNTTAAGGFPIFTPTTDGAPAPEPAARVGGAPPTFTENSTTTTGVEDGRR